VQDIPTDSIYPGDCLTLLKSLPSECLDLVVSSPPYNIGKDYESKRELDLYLEDQRKVLSELARCLKQTGSIFWQVGSYAHEGTLIPLDIRFFPILERVGLTPRNRIIWVRQHGLHASRKFSARHESILWFTKSESYKFNLDAVRVPQKYQNKKAHRGENKGELSCNPLGKNPGDIWIFQNVKHNHEEQTIHPCQFPEDLITRITLAVTDLADIVCDPYMGSGTVAVVARDFGRHYVGAETDMGYLEVAMRRINGEPNAQGSFANLKTLRAYVKRTGEPIKGFRFDVQASDSATNASQSKRYPEEHHLTAAEERLSYEEAHFSARVNDRPLPDNPHPEHLPKAPKAETPSLFP
jgi:adenine-specific DNA-methyltransferase